MDFNSRLYYCTANRITAVAATEGRLDQHEFCKNYNVTTPLSKKKAIHVLCFYRTYFAIEPTCRLFRLLLAIHNRSPLSITRCDNIRNDTYTTADT